MSAATSAPAEAEPGADARDGLTGRAAEIEAEPSAVKRAGKILGPGLITGAADDDPSGIGTYAVAGATLGLATLWTAFITFPFMAAVQNIAARVGIATGMGLAGVIVRNFPRWIVVPVVLALAAANTVNAGADLGAMADAVEVVTGVQAVWLVVPMGAAIVALQLFADYALITRVFRWLTLALFAYIVNAVLLKPDLRDILRATVIPTFSLDPNFLKVLIAVLGTTISPYLFFWQSGEEAEQKRDAQRKDPQSHRRWRWLPRYHWSEMTKKEIRYSTIDTNVGMAFSNLVMYFIILTTALTLFKAGKHDIQSGADAAQALQPLAGSFAGLLFASGMIGAGILAVPVLTGSAAYALSEVFGWKRGLHQRWNQAKPYYAAITVSTFIGVAINFTGINPIEALLGSSVLMGVLSPPLLVLLMLSARSTKIMGEHAIGPLLTTLGWLVTAAMVLNVVALAYITFFS